jgi:RNA-binding protein YlmH
VEHLNLASLPEEDAQFLRRLADLSELSAAKGIRRFTAFLTERQAHIATEYIRQRKVEGAVLYGGYDDAVRKMCGFFPVFEAAGADVFPLRAVSLRYRAEKALGHRDFLGTLLSLGVKREAIGDILPGSGLCAIFLTNTVAPFVMQELVMMGGEGVSCEYGADISLLPEPEFAHIKGTVGSTRMDSLVKLLTGYAREKSAALIRGGLVKRNDFVVASVSDAFSPGDKVTIRGFGKYIIDKTGSPTRKGRIQVEARKYM